MSVKSRKFARAVLLFCAAGSALSCAAHDPDPDPNLGALSSAIAGGEPDSTDSNVFLLFSHRGTEGVALCSASLIAPNLLLTARHCVANVTSEQVTCGKTTAGAPFAANTFFAANTASIDDVTKANAFRVSSISVPSEDGICGFDVALVTLTSPVPSGVAQPLVPRIDRAVGAGERYTAVGYGTDEPGDGGIAGLRRGRSGLRVNCAPGQCSASAGAELSEFIGDAGICSGDSGGPALDADGKVVGVVSRSADNCNHPVYGSVAAWKDWIDDVATAAAAQGKYAVPFWVASGSSDDPGGTAGNGSEPAAGAQGEACSLAQACPAGYACYSPTNSASAGDAYCSAQCSATAQCSTGTMCDPATGVCIAPPHSEGGSSACALSAGSRSSSSGAAGLAGLALMLACARRAKHAKRECRRASQY